MFCSAIHPGFAATEAQRKRELVVTTRGKLGQWLKLIAPGIEDRIARKAIEEGR